MPDVKGNPVESKRDLSCVHERNQSAADARAENTKCVLSPTFPLPAFSPRTPFACVYPTVAPSLNKLSNHVTTLVDALGRLEHRLSLIGGDGTPRSTDHTEGAEDAEGAEGADDSEDYDEEDPDSGEDGGTDVPAVVVKEEIGSRLAGRTEGKLKPHEILQTIAGLQSVLERLDERTKVLVEGTSKKKKKEKVIKVKVEGKEGGEWEGKGDGENAGMDSMDQNEDFNIQQLKGTLITNQSSSGRPAVKRQKHQRWPSNMDPLLATSLVPLSPSPSPSLSSSSSSSLFPFPSPSPPSPLWTIAYTGVGLTIDARIHNLHDLRTFLSDFKKLSVQEDKQETSDNSLPSLASAKPHFTSNDSSDIPDDSNLRLTKTERFGKEAIIRFGKDRHQNSADTSAITNAIPDLGIAPSEQIIQHAMRYLLDAYFAKRCCHQHRTPFLEHNSFFRDHYSPATFSAMADPDLDPAATASLLLIYSMCAFGCKKSFLCHPPSTGPQQPSPDEAFVERMEVHFYNLARELLGEAFDTPSLPAIQSLIHLHFFDCFRRKHDVADKLIGIAVRMAFDLSLFKPEEPDELADSPRSFYQPYDSPASGSTGSSGPAPMTREREERRLTAFKLLFLDFYSAFHVGRPAAINDREWDRVPSQRKQIEAHVSANEPYLDDPTRPAIVRLFVCMLELTRVQKRIMQLPETQERVLKLKQAREEAQAGSERAIADDNDDEDGDEEPDHLIARKGRSLIEALAEWYRRLPDYFIFDLANPDANPDDTFSLTLASNSPTSLNLDPAQSANRMMTLCRLALHQAYHLNRILLYRQFIPVSADEQTQSSDTFLNLCLDAARGIARLTELLVENGSCFIHLQAVFFAGFVYSRIGKLYPGDPEAVNVATKGLHRCIGALKRSVPFRFGLDLCRDYVGMIEKYLTEVETAVQEHSMAQEQA
ncbi:hypothetical protein BC937DRAFT_89253 [Endogone sp. FLAS-F59071]|nr:hypothetical protein BC937DRAFT_89253 [Endogone sp. FLAS-F59071]|eukprot:RUS18000.1 hypothetical protein BC937DRAFT_89253 [Endogone sp. FLAS-F59071]